MEGRITDPVVPEADAAKAAGELLRNLPRLWSAATTRPDSDVTLYAVEKGSARCLVRVSDGDGGGMESICLRLSQIC